MAPRLERKMRCNATISSTVDSSPWNGNNCFKKLGFLLKNSKNMTQSTPLFVCSLRSPRTIGRAFRLLILVPVYDLGPDLGKLDMPFRRARIPRHKSTSY